MTILLECVKKKYESRAALNSSKPYSTCGIMDWIKIPPERSNAVTDRALRLGQN